MNVLELQSIVDDAKDVQKKNRRKDPTLAENLKVEIENFENKVKDIMNKPYNELTDDDLIPEEIVTAAEYLRTCHTV